MPLDSNLSKLKKNEWEKRRQKQGKYFKYFVFSSPSTYSCKVRDKFTSNGLKFNCGGGNPSLVGVVIVQMYSMQLVTKDLNSLCFLEVPVQMAHCLWLIPVVFMNYVA